MFEGRGSKLLGKWETIVELCPAPRGTSGDGTVKNCKHAPRLKPGTILSEDSSFFDFYLYRMSIWSKYVASLFSNLQCFALGNCYLSVL